MIVTSGPNVEGHKIKEYKGIVRGVIVRSPTIGQGFMGSLGKMLGGQNAAYTKMCEQTRAEAHALCEAHAQQIGANAVIAMRYDASELSDGVTEVLCYGTAVVIE
jgi:uncharacterized protein YbjQ (UPF0145 family)